MCLVLETIWRLALWTTNSGTGNFWHIVGIDRVCSIQDQVCLNFFFLPLRIYLYLTNIILTLIAKETHSNSKETKMDTGFDELSLYSPRNNTNLSKFTHFRGPSTIVIIIITREPLKSQKALLL